MEIYIYIFKDFIYLYLQSGEGDKPQCEIETFISCFLHAPQLGTGPTTQALTQPGIEPATFRFMG